MSNPYNNKSLLKKAQKKASAKFGKNIILKPSTRKFKKLDAFMKMKDGKLKKLSSFGDKRYGDFLITNDKKKRKAYRARHKKDLLIKNKYSPGKFSYYVLW